MTRSERVRAVRERLFETGVVIARANGRTRELFPVAIGIKEGLALRDRVRQEKARHTLEVGLGYGIATLFICEALVANGPDPASRCLRPTSVRGASAAIRRRMRVSA